jgi:hypothetical protein
VCEYCCRQGAEPVIADGVFAAALSVLTEPDRRRLAAARATRRPGAETISVT